MAVLVSHPIQYQVPLYQALARHPRIDLTVFYCSSLGISGIIDPEFGIPLKWDLDMLRGYPHRFLRNYSPLSPGRFCSLFNPGIVPALFRGHFDAIMIPGYSYVTYLLGFVTAWLSRTSVFLRGEVVLRTGAGCSLKSLAKKWLVRAILKGTRACLSIGMPSRLFYEAYGVPADRIFSSPYSVDNDFFFSESQRWRRLKADIKRALRIPSEMPIILFCGKLIPRKRPGDLLACLRYLTSPTALLFVGEGCLHSSLQQEARGYPYVRFTGFINQREIPKYYAVADIFVLPSEREAAPLAINEAAACGLPLILSGAIPSAVDFVKPGENGFVFPMGDTKMLASYLNKLLEDVALRHRMGRRSLELISSWGIQASVAGILRACEGALSPKPSRGAFLGFESLSQA